MSFQEYQSWALYFDQRPEGWKDDDRTFKLMQAFGHKGSPQNTFHSLAKMLTKEEEKKAAAIIPRSGSLLHTMMQNAKGGDRLAILGDL